MINNKSWLYGESGKLNQPYTPKQFGLIKALEKKSGLVFQGRTKRDAQAFIDRANKQVTENMLYEKYRKDESS